MLTYHQGCSVASSWEQFHKRCSWTKCTTCVQRLLPDGTKQINTWTTMWTYHQNVLWHSHKSNFTRNAHELNSWHVFRNYPLKINTASPRGQQFDDNSLSVPLLTPTVRMTTPSKGTFPWTSGMGNVTHYNIEGILPKGPYPPCLRMADRALLAGYPRIVLSY